MDELELMCHLVSTYHLQLCENDEKKIAIKFSQMIFRTVSKKSEIYNLKNTSLLAVICCNKTTKRNT